MQSVFNWRTPLPVWLVAVLPQGWAEVLLMGTAGVMWLLGLALLGTSLAAWASPPAWRRSAGRCCPVCSTTSLLCPKFGPAC